MFEWRYCFLYLYINWYFLGQVSFLIHLLLEYQLSVFVLDLISEITILFEREKIRIAGWIWLS